MAKRSRVAESGEGQKVAAITHDKTHRKNIPTAEHRSVMNSAEQSAIRIAYERRNRDLDPQLVWRGKDQRDWSDLVVHAPPIYIQEKVHPKVLIDDLQRETRFGKHDGEYPRQADLFLDFNGLPKNADKTEFYRHDQNWTNRMILGDSLQVMASLAEREGLRGKVQCIYFDPPYGIKFNSNFQWSTTSRDVKDGNATHITREPEQVKAFRDTWRDGIHSYLGYLRDRLTVARDLLAETGSIFVQIGDENVHRVRALLDEVFGEENVISQIAFRTTTGRVNEMLPAASNYLIWAARDRAKCKYRPPFQDKAAGSSTDQVYALWKDDFGASGRLTKAQRSDPSSLPRSARVFQAGDLTSARPAGAADVKKFVFRGETYTPGKGTFKTDAAGLARLGMADRLWPTSTGSLRYIRYFSDFPVIPFSNVWTDTGTGSFTEEKVYVVQTNTKVVERCLLMTSDPGDLVMDPTCGSGTTAIVAEQWGRRWITIDTSRVALALARGRVMGARFPYYLLADSHLGRAKEAELSKTRLDEQEPRGDIRMGFVYARVPHVMLSSISNNEEIDTIWERWNGVLAPLLAALNKAVRETWNEWDVPASDDPGWSKAGREAYQKWREARGARQREIDASVQLHGGVEYLYDRPYEDAKTIRVSGPFTVESLSPHRMLAMDDDDELINRTHGRTLESDSDRVQTFPQMVLENLRVAGVQQVDKKDRISFVSLLAWPGELVCAEGRYLEGDKERRAAIFIGPEFGTVQRADLVEAAKEAGDADFDVLVACAFSYEAHATEFAKLGRIPVLKARMNADLHMSEDLKNNGKGNLFVIFGEPEIEVITLKDKRLQIKIHGVSVFHPQTGEVRSDGPEGIACWFIDTEYNEESFFVRHAYFLGANDPYNALRTTLRAEIDEAVWESLHSDTSRPFRRPNSGRIAVKVINHLGDEVMKVFKV